MFQCSSFVYTQFAFQYLITWFQIVKNMFYFGHNLNLHNWNDLTGSHCNMLHRARFESFNNV